MEEIEDYPQDRNHEENLSSEEEFSDDEIDDLEGIHCVFCGQTPCLYFANLENILSLTGFPGNIEFLKPPPRKWKKVQFHRRKVAYAYYYSIIYNRRIEDLDKQEVRMERLPVCIQKNVRKLYPSPNGRYLVRKSSRRLLGEGIEDTNTYLGKKSKR